MDYNDDIFPIEGFRFNIEWLQEDLAKALERTDRSNVFYNGLKVADSIVTDKKNKLCAEAGASLVARRNDKNRKLLRETVKR